MTHFMNNTMKVQIMRKYQTGEAILAVMVVMMAAIWLVSGHTGGMGGMMGHGAHTEELAEPQQPTATLTLPVPDRPAGGRQTERQQLREQS